MAKIICVTSGFGASVVINQRWSLPRRTSSWPLRPAAARCPMPHHWKLPLTDAPAGVVYVTLPPS